MNDLQAKRIINEFAVGGAVAAILHNEAISTIDLDIFFFLAEKDDSPILSLSAIYDYAKENGCYLVGNRIFTATDELLTINNIIGICLYFYFPKK